MCAQVLNSNYMEHEHTYFPFCEPIHTVSMEGVREREWNMVEVEVEPGLY